MNKYRAELQISQAPVSLSDFLRSYNANMPDSFPRATVPLLKKFKHEHSSLFKNGEMWSLDLHRKKLMDWLPLNSRPA